MQLPRVDRKYSNLSKLPPYILFLTSVGEEELKNQLYIAAGDLDEVEGDHSLEGSYCWYRYYLGAKPKENPRFEEYNFRFIDIL
jgi:hypothetical protein